MGIPEDYNILERLENLKLAYAIEILEEEIATGNVHCDCQDCVLDILARSLNQVMPRYHISYFEGNMPEPTISDKEIAELRDAVKDSIKVISAQPHHD